MAVIFFSLISVSSSIQPQHAIFTQCKRVTWPFTSCLIMHKCEHESSLTLSGEFFSKLFSWHFLFIVLDNSKSSYWCFNAAAFCGYHNIWCIYFMKNQNHSCISSYLSSLPTNISDSKSGRHPTEELLSQRWANGSPETLPLRHDQTLQQQSREPAVSSSQLPEHDVWFQCSPGWEALT